ncbi:MAG: purine-binding chemotaxis protein CheW [Spirochaetes bacterium]|nr:purine-binding chemotaxis protein CheW [Spirochaetota bacterium]
MHLRELLTSVQGQASRAAAREEKATVETLSFVAFRVGSREYAIDIDEAREIIKIQKISLVPNAPHWLRGVTNLRGEIIPIIEIGARFQPGAPAAPAADGKTPSQRLKDRSAVVSRVDQTVFALLVDEIKGTLRVPADHVSRRPELLKSIGNEFVQALIHREPAPGATGESLLLVLNLDKVSRLDRDTRD